MKFRDYLKATTLIMLIGILGLILIGASFSSFIIEQLIYNPNKLDGIGFTDSMEYWSAFKLWQSGHNPYDDQAMLQFQSTIRATNYAIMMWNPPWLLVIFMPLLSIDSFLTFARIWAAFSVLSYLCGILILISSFAPKYIKDPKLWIVLLSFAPFSLTISFGQISCWLFIGACLVLVGIKQENVYSTIIGSSLLSLKPHLFIVFLFSLTLILLKQRNYKLILALYLTPLLLAGVSEFIFSPGIIINWLNTISGRTPPTTTPQPQLWITTTLPSVISAELSINNFTVKYFISFTSLALALLISLRLIVQYQWQYAIALILLISMPLGSFGWLYDYTLLVVSIIILWPLLSQSARTLNYVLASCLIMLVSCTMLIHELHQGLIPILIFISILFALGIKHIDYAKE